MIEYDYYTEEIHGKHEYFELGNFELESGVTLPNARLAYKTFGRLNEAKDNVVLFPHMYSGTSHDMDTRFIGQGRPLDPTKYSLSSPGSSATGSLRRRPTHRRLSIAGTSRMSRSAMTCGPSTAS